MGRTDKSQTKLAFEARKAPKTPQKAASEVDTVVEGISTLEATLVAMQRSLQSIEGSMAAVNNRLDHMSSQLEKQNARMGEVEQRVSAAEDGLTAVTGKTLNMEKVLSLIQAKNEDLEADLQESKFLLTHDNHTNLVIRIFPEAVGFTYLTFNEGDTVPIAYKSHLYTSAEMRFSTVEKVLTAVQMAILKERALSQGKSMLVVTQHPALETVTKASVPNSKALHPQWIQWATSLTSPDVTFIFYASLQSQEFLQYEFVHSAPLTMRSLEDFHCIIYTDGSAQVAHGSKHAYSSGCAIVAGTMANGEFKSNVVHTQTLGDCTAQLSELRALMLALEYADPGVTTLIVSDSYYCVQSYNDNLFFWTQNDYRDSKGSTIKHKMIWVRVAELKEQLPLVYAIHTFGYQRVGAHTVGNSLAEEAAKTAVSTYLVAAVTRSKSKIDDDILAAIVATEKGSKYPTGFPSKYSYHLSSDKVPFVKIPDVGDRLIPNADCRSALITAAHEGVASAHENETRCYGNKSKEMLTKARSTSQRG
ncbi:uncharacterized protein LOC144752612 [Lissotriton helveticus]